MRTTMGRWPLTIAMMASLLISPALMAQEEKSATEAPKPKATSSLALLKAIPSDATAFVAIRSLKDLDNNIVNIANTLGYPMGPEGLFPAPLEWLKSELELTAGINDNGGIALVLLSLEGIETPDEMGSRIAIFIPTTDAKALLKGLEAEEGKEGVYTFNFRGEPSIALIKGDFLIVAQAPEGADKAPSKVLLAAAKAGGDGINKNMSPDRLQAFNKQDLFVWAKPQAIPVNFRNKIIEELAAHGGGSATTKPDQGGKPEPGKDLKEALEQTDEVSGGISVNAKTGIAFSFYMRAKEGSNLAKTMEAAQPPKDSLLTGLPNEAPVVVFGSVGAMTPESKKKLQETMDQFAAKVMEFREAHRPKIEGKNPSANNKGIKPLFETFVELLGASERGAFLVSHLAPKDAVSKDAAEKDGKSEKAVAAPSVDAPMGVTLVFETKDNKAFKANVKKAFEQLKTFIGEMAPLSDDDTQKKVSKAMDAVVWKDGTAKGDQPAIDTFDVKLDQLPDMGPDEVQAIKAVMGEEGFLVRIACVGEKHVVIAMGGGEKRMASVIEAVEKKQAPLVRNPSIAKVAGRLPAAKRISEGYFDVSNLFELIKTIVGRIPGASSAPQFMILKGISLTNAAPIALTAVSVDATAQETQVLIPLELIQSINNAVKQAMASMMGGMMGGGGDGGPEGMSFDKDDDSSSHEATPGGR